MAIDCMKGPSGLPYDWPSPSIRVLNEADVEEMPGPDHLVNVAVPCPLPQPFSYEAESAISPGTRVLIPFGRQEKVGVVLGGAEFDSSLKYQKVKSVIDDQPVLSPRLLELGQWMASYYHHPIGEVLRTMTPAGHKIQRKETWHLSGQGQRLLSEPPSRTQEKYRQLLSALFGKTPSTARTRATLLAKCKKLQPSDPAGTLNELKKKGFVTSEVVKEVRTMQIEHQQPPPDLASSSDTAPKLNEEQQNAVDVIAAELQSDRAQPILIHGITGSGKTEVYMAAINNLLTQNPRNQVLVMVPEIALTPQVTRNFEARFPGMVEVVHSELADQKRWMAFNRIRSGRSRILIGPRSAVFAPFVQLGLIIVDEEHDQSYKQSSGLMYHGRDVAVVRGKLENAVVVLGSATPSIESYDNSQRGRYRYVALTKRATGGQLPDILLVEARRKTVVRGIDPDSVDARIDGVSSTVSPLSKDVIRALEASLERGEQSIVVVNRRGFAFYLLDHDTEEVVDCPNCAVSLTLHKRKHTLVCHYCGHQQSLRELLRKSERSFLAVGFGSQQAEDLLRMKLPTARIERLDSDSAGKKGHLSQVLDGFRAGKIDVLVGTQILAKGHDFPNVTLTVICDIDQSLNFPDFRAGERAFQLLVQAAGRAGRHGRPGQVLIQTSHADHPIIDAAVNHDYLSFAQFERSLRQTHGFPPASKMIAVEYSATNVRHIDKLDHSIINWMQMSHQRHPELYKGLAISGPSVPPIECLRGRFRRMLMIQAPSQAAYRPWLSAFWQQFGKPSGDIRIHVDIDPQNLI